MSKEKQNNSANILAFTRYARMGASSRLRTYQYIPKFKAAGYDVEVCPLFGEDYLEQLYGEGKKSPATVIRSYLARLGKLLVKGSPDLVWIEKELFPYLPFRLENAFISSDLPVMVDYDDAIFHGYDQHSNPLINRLYGDKIACVMEASDAVLCGNEYLAAYAREAGASKAVHLPTVVDTSRYRVKEYGRVSSGESVTIGWIGSPSTVPYLERLLPILERLSKEYAIQLKVVGGRLQTSTTLDVVYEPWSEETETRSIVGCDIGVMPLEKTKWARGKCAYKLIQYMACGLPVVGSDFGANREVVTEGTVGFLANSEKEWYRYLETLITDADCRQKMGLSGRKRVEKYYSLNSVSQKLIGVVNSLVAG